MGHVKTSLWIVLQLLQTRTPTKYLPVARQVSGHEFIRRLSDLKNLGFSPEIYASALFSHPAKFTAWAGLLAAMWR
jgi:hypothetical protein